MKEKILGVIKKDSEGKFVAIDEPKTIKDFYVNFLLEEAILNPFVDHNTAELRDLFWTQAYFTKINHQLAMLDSDLEKILEDDLKKNGTQSAMDKADQIVRGLITETEGFPKSPTKKQKDDIATTFSSSLLMAVMSKGIKEDLYSVEVKENFQNAIKDYLTKRSIDKLYEEETERKLKFLKVCAARQSGAINLMATIYDGAKEKGIETYGDKFTQKKLKVAGALKVADPVNK